ncbi:uncharacterized protein LOC131840985 [Achroia grisella]|uniref:uncharacterized protein LOC131840985 n=1 Tax=Achroia grisella TaxID=688607 RepID=UPI0027D291EF|nr:uncharacterized protein LOC131840985 [Achroia grisella]
MPLSTCSSGLIVTALVALLFLPAQYYVPDLYSKSEEEFETPQTPTVSPPTNAWFYLAFTHFPPLDIFFTLVLLMSAFLTYICEWIQRKIMERRIVKLNQYLFASVDRLREWDARHEQLEATLKMVQNATAEYNLLLYLLLRKHRCLAAHTGPPSNCFFDKEFEDDLFLRSPTVEQPAL